MTHTLADAPSCLPVSAPEAAAPLFLQHAAQQRHVKGEDMFFIAADEGHVVMPVQMFFVCDGHAGPDAAVYAATHMPELLRAAVPDVLPDFENAHDVLEYAERVRRSVAEACVQCDNDWCKIASESGTTMTAVLLTGQLLTVANLGDSLAILDTGEHVQEVTHSHRIQTNKGEQLRLREEGATVAPLAFDLSGPARQNEVGVGPLRLWPGGLCVGRTVGDRDAGSYVVPLPHIKQLLVPSGGSRLILASDGLWDVVSLKKAASLVRSKLTQPAAAALVAHVARDRRAADDVSVVVVDIMPDAKTTFPTACTAIRRTLEDHPKARGGFFSCCRAPAADDDTPEPSGRGGAHNSDAPALLADVDCLYHYPALARRSLRITMPAGRPESKLRSDYTVHGNPRAQVYQEEHSWHQSEGSVRNTGPALPVIHSGVASSPSHLSGGAARPATALAAAAAAGAAGEKPHQPAGGWWDHSGSPRMSGAGVTAATAAVAVAQKQVEVAATKPATVLASVTRQQLTNELSVGPGEELTSPFVRSQGAAGHVKNSSRV